MKCTCFSVCDIVLFLASTMHQYERFQARIFTNFLGRGSPSPLPRPLPPFFLGLRPRFGLRPQYSGASRPRLSTKNLSKWMKLCCAPQWGSLDPPLVNPRTPRGGGGGVDATPLAFFPVTFFMIPIAKIASAYLLISVNRDGRHILTYVTSS